MGRIGRMTILVLACVLPAMGTAWAQAGPPPQAGTVAPPAGESDGIAYASGGVGAEERAGMDALRGQYNLRMVFATRGSGAMLADVTLRIADATGTVALALTGCGPQVYVRLAPGRYTVAVAADGVEQRRRVTVGRAGARELYFYWQGNPADAG